VRAFAEVSTVIAKKIFLPLRFHLKTTVPAYRNALTPNPSPACGRGELPRQLALDLNILV
ncbi:MAG TPA: hypothetical protein VM532_14305, partial [Burkholderiales bacterium]|nr:hypothetical protein [Burkholderiales bacterium]